MSPEPVNLIEPERYYAFWGEIRILLQWGGAIVIGELAAILVFLGLLVRHR